MRVNMVKYYVDDNESARASDSCGTMHNYWAGVPSALMTLVYVVNEVQHATWIIRNSMVWPTLEKKKKKREKTVITIINGSD